MVDPQVLLDAGQSQLDASNNAGAWTWTFADGVADYLEPRGRACRINYVLSGDRFLGIGRDSGCDIVLPLIMARDGDMLTMAPWPQAPTGMPLTGQDGNRMLPDPAGFAAAFFHHPFLRLGDAT